MSRSRKKHPSYSDYNPNYTPWSKRQASKKVRKYKPLTNGSLYKKVYSSYDIFDYKGLWTKHNYGCEGVQEVPNKAYRK